MQIQPGCVKRRLQGGRVGRACIKQDNGKREQKLRARPLTGLLLASLRMCRKLAGLRAATAPVP